MSSRPNALKPLRHARFRLLATSMVLSLGGAGLLVVALVWQVVALGGGPAELSVVATATAVGLVSTALLGGVLADRVPQRRILIASETTKTVAVGVAAGLAWTGHLQVWHLAAAALVGGVMDGLYYPAYSALVPALLPEEDLLGANGLEGFARTLALNAGGPAVAGAVIAATSPAVALAVTAACTGAAAGVLLALPTTPLRRDLAGAPSHPVRAVLHDLAEGFRYLIATPWLHATLAYASLVVLLVMGPFEVLLPFAIKDRAGGGPAEHSLVLAAFGLGGAAGSLVVSSIRLPRRYLTAMNLTWGLGCLPLIVHGTTRSIPMMVAAAAVVGAAFNGAQVIWGTLLQRRVPSGLLGRVSSLDFFVSLAFMPVSMALAGPVSEAIGLTPTFVIAATLPVVFAVVAIAAARMPADELAHPLRDDAEAPVEPATTKPRP